MRAQVVDAPSGPLRLRELPVPAPGPGQVLVRVAAAPVNPSDLGIIDGHYGERRFPLVPGAEASGTVVGAGPGILPRTLLGRRVACASPPPLGGTYAEYVLTEAARCVPLFRSVDDEQGAMLLINPLSALGILAEARRGRHRALVSTAATGALGAMITRLARRAGLPVIAVVRREALVDVALAQGARLALSSTRPDFVDRLREAALELRATLLLDAVSGEMTGRLLEAAPERSTVLVYGALSHEAIRADPRSLFHGERSVGGFFLATWARREGLVRVAMAAARAQRLVHGDLASRVRERVPLAGAGEAIERYRSDMGLGKILIVLHEHA
jgi:NADPH:quinone reductase